MSISNKTEPLFLLLGDIFFLVVSLWLALLIRYGEAEVYTQFAAHIEPFSILFIVWLFVFFIAGLYEKHTLLLKNRLPSLILNTLLANTILAVLFFYLIPYFGIAPKTNLFIYLLASFALLVIWRQSAVHVLSSPRRWNTVLVGTGDMLRDLQREINHNSRYSLKVVDVVDTNDCSGDECLRRVQHALEEKGATIVIADTHHPVVEEIIPQLYNLLFEGVRFLDMAVVYEEVFDRIPLSLVKYSWFLEHLRSTKGVYDGFKRAMDIILALIGGVVSLVFYPFIIAAIKLDDGGLIFYTALRTGQNNEPFVLYKFRTMSSMDGGKEVVKSNGEITRVGQFLRKSRLDELPQFWNVFRGDISFVGPRPEFPELVRHYKEEVPYYNVRHLIKPGLSGWAQMYHENHPHHGADASATKEKLSFDLFYIKNRSIILDIKIALKTLKVFFIRSGR
ncbi:MAG: exopolysaccharide biosynthesis polyprenyl glycosylphosphotransferase [Candidatus Paceibacterota bacterium]